MIFHWISVEIARFSIESVHLYIAERGEISLPVNMQYMLALATVVVGGGSRIQHELTWLLRKGGPSADTMVGVFIENV